METIYEAVNQPVLRRVPKTVKRILDIGCGSGALGKKLKQERNCEVIGITYSHSEASLAASCLDQVLLRDLNILATDELGKFDCIICSHILEHLYQPEKLLEKLHQNFTPDGMIIVALPNVLFWKQRLEFLKGNFKYKNSGLMDKTHFRFYDWETAHELVEKSGYEIVEEEAEGGFPLPFLRPKNPQLSWKIDKLATSHFPGIFGMQFVFSCKLLC